MENGWKESLEKFGEISLWAIENPTIAISTEGNVVLATHMKKRNLRYIWEMWLTGPSDALDMEGEEECCVQDDNCYLLVKIKGLKCHSWRSGKLRKE